MKILFVLSSFQRGGEQRVVSILANKFAKEGFSVNILLLNFSDIAYDLDSSIDVKFLEKEDNKQRKKIFKNISRINQLKRYFKKNEFSYIIGFAIIPSILCSIAKVFSKTNCKVIVCERNNPNNYSIIWKIIRRIAYIQADGAIFQTKDAQDYFKNWLSCPSEIIYNPVDLSLFPKELCSRERKKKIVTVGRLVEAKNHKLLINAFNNVVKIYPDYELIIYGEGKERKSLEKLINDLDLVNKVFLLGETKDVFNEIKDCELFVLSSNHEGFPNVLIEAMCLGLAVISTDCPIGGPRTIIKSEINGILTPIMDETKLTENILLCLENKDLRDFMSKNALKVKELVDANCIFNQWYTFLRRL